MRRNIMYSVWAFLLLGCLVAWPATARAGFGFISRFHTISTVASTVPGNGDVNPYGVAVAPRSIGMLVAGDVLVSNFNASSNLQGTGTTIMQISPGGAVSQFARIDPNTLPGACPGGVGLTTALAVLSSGWVIVGSLPTTDGTPATIGAGCLLVLNSQGIVVETIAGGAINGPWDMTAIDNGPSADLFVTNVLNGTVAGGGNVVNGGTVVRLLLGGLNGKPFVAQETVVGSGFPERTDPSALVIGPTGVGLGPGFGPGVGPGVRLYVADSLDNRIAVIPDALFRGTSAGIGITVSSGGALNDPLGLAAMPNGQVLTVNGGDGNLVDTAPSGAQIGVMQLDGTGNPAGAGTLFGLAVAPANMGVYFVDDGSNTLNLLHR